MILSFFKAAIQVERPQNKINMHTRRLEIMSPVPTGAMNRLSKTPVEYISPLGRRLVVLANSSNKSPGTFLSPTVMNDDEAEKRERQLTRVLELQQKSIGTSPATPAERRQSLALGRLTNAQLAEHYADCIKLSTENKISAKNAFGLHLIDYIGELFKKKDVTDFQLASCTIDASAKIYAGRVDAIHSETYKVLTGLGRGANHAQKTGEDQNDDVEVGEDGGKQKELDKKRKRARKSHTVETNLKNITLTKFDLDFEVDPMFQKTVAAFDEGGTAGLLLNHLRCLNDTCELVLDCKTIVTSTEDDSSSQTNQSKTVDVSELKDILAATDLEKLEICPQFSQFEFGNWSMEEMSSLASDREKLGKKDHIFDLDAEPEPIDDVPLPPSDVGDIIDDEFGPIGADDDDDEAHDFGHDAVFPAPVEDRKQLEATTAKLKEGYMNDLISILTSEPSDYSYFRTDLRTWAGPDHLRLQRRLKDSTITAGEKLRKKTKVKEPFLVTFDEDIDVDSHFELKRAATTITATTLEKHSRMRTTLPEDLHYDDKQLVQLFLMPSVVIKQQQANSQLLEVAQYNYDNVNDRCNFCPEADACDVAGAADDDDDNDNDVGERLDFNLTSGDLSQTQASASSEGTMAEGSIVSDFMGNNLVAPPRKIAKIDLDYAKVAKKVDVKQLKQAMWEILTRQSKEAVNAPEKASSSNQKSEMGFQELLNELTKLESKTVARNLSVPIAFVSLLHLANEKTLDIRNVGDMMADLNIMHDTAGMTGK